MKKILKVFMKEDCRTCRLLQMKVDTVAKEPYMKAKIEYIYVEKDERQALAYDIQSAPTMILLIGDSLAWRHVGNLSYHDLRNHIEA